MEEEEEGEEEEVVLNMEEKSDTNVQHRLKRFIPLLRGFSGRKTPQKRSTVTDLRSLKLRLTDAGSNRHLVATLTITQTRAALSRVEVHLLWAMGGQK